MNVLTMAVVVSLALVAGCNRNTTTPPSPKTDTSSAAPQAGAGSSATPANTATPSIPEKREGSNPQQGQVDPKQAEQHRDFQQKGDAAGPTSSDTKPTIKN